MASGGAPGVVGFLLSMKIPELKRHLGELGLPTTGVKAVLIDRLMQSSEFNEQYAKTESRKLELEISRLETELEISRLQNNVKEAKFRLSQLQAPPIRTSSPHASALTANAHGRDLHVNSASYFRPHSDPASDRPAFNSCPTEGINTHPRPFQQTTASHLPDLQLSSLSVVDAVKGLPEAIVPKKIQHVGADLSGVRHGAGGHILGDGPVHGQESRRAQYAVDGCLEGRRSSALSGLGGMQRGAGVQLVDEQSVRRSDVKGVRWDAGGSFVGRQSGNSSIAGDRLGSEFMVNGRQSTCGTDAADLSTQIRGQMAEMADAMQQVGEAVSLSRLPVPEPPVFSGDPLQYDEWNDAFKSLIEQRAKTDADKMYYLKRYVKGRALKAVKAYRSSAHTGGNAYEKAKQVLDDRYGSPFKISEAYRQRLDEWPKVPPRDSQALEEFVDFLLQCESVMVDIPEMDFLDNCRQNQRMLTLLPDYVVTRWNQKVVDFEISNKRFPPFLEFVNFLVKELRMASHPITSLESVRKRHSTSSKSSISHASSEGVTYSDEQPSCILCSQHHSLHDCVSFNTMPQAQRYDLVRSHRLCFNCFNSGHSAITCHSTYRCTKCKNKHHTLLHRGRNQSTTTTTNCGSTHMPPSQPTTTCLSAMIVPVWVYSRRSPKKRWLTYAMLDSQSDATFLTDEVASRIDGVHATTTIKLSTMTSKDHLIKCQRYTDLVVRGYHSDNEVLLPQAYTRGFIPHNREHIPTPEVAKAWPHLEEISDCLISPESCDVGLLIGYNCPEAIVPTKVIRAQPNQPYGVKTGLGWSIVGRWSTQAPERVDVVGISHRVMCLEVPSQFRVRCDDSLGNGRISNEILISCRAKTKETSMDPERIFRLMEGEFIIPESVSLEPGVSQDDMRFMTTLQQDIFQTAEGFYSMPLPFKQDKPVMPSNKTQAVSRFKKLHERLLRDPAYSQKYHDFMNAALLAGEAERIPESELKAEEVWYLPHHGVLNARKPGKLRVVFDGSARFRGHCLNDYLLTGPNLNSNLIGILTRFRQYPVAISCDIRNMFHQFRVTGRDRDFFRFLWVHPDSDELIAEYRMTSHLFGSASSPGCAKFGLNQVVKDHGSSNPDVADFVSRNFYVDDGLTSCPTVAQAVTLLKDTQAVLAKGRLKLHKLMSSDQNVLNEFEQSDWASRAEPSLSTALGLKWMVDTDEFTFEPPSGNQKTLSRRIMLSVVAGIFDPLGLLSPIVLRGKLIIQQTCQGIDWDDELPEEIIDQWQQWTDEVSHLSKVVLKRCLQPKGFGVIVEAELHVFADASLSGYGSCCYLRLRDDSGWVHCSLLFSKSKVVPVSSKGMTIPRLELLAAVLAARIGSKMALELEFDAKQYYYSDSNIVLGYIVNSSKRFRMFVANRIAEIRELTSINSWMHVDGEQNPADHASRGLAPEQLLKSNWLTGPAFLWKPGRVPANLPEDLLDANDPEVIHTVHATSCSEFILPDHIAKFSKWESVVRFSCVLIHILRHHWKGPKFSISVQLQEDAKVWLIRQFQLQWFADEFQQLATKGTVSRSSKLWQLDPFVDEFGLMRVGGRLKYSSTLTYKDKHPVVLAQKSHLTQLVVRYYHELMSHQGRGITIAAVRNAGYWVVSLNRVVASLLYYCVQCRKLRRPVEGQKMADLPSERTDPAPPFTYIGMDCFGPFQVKDGRKTHKKYGLIFVCMYSRAIHVELLDDLSTDCFINSLRTFFALRGPAREIKCDQGTNFVGAANELRDAFQELGSGEIKDFLLKHHCDFVFNSPSSSHMGGSWERQIRTFRSVLNGVLGRTALDSSSARTVMYEVMSIVNSRPLTTVEETLEPISPNHLLHMKSGLVLPPPGQFTELDEYSRKRWRKVQSLVTGFWKRWRPQYLSNLQRRPKWPYDRRSLKVGDVVLLKDETVRSEWRIGRVEELLTSHDGLVRRVKVVVGARNSSKSTTILERPVQKTVLLVEVP